MSLFAAPQTADVRRRQVFQELKPRCIALSQTILTSKLNPQALTSSLSDLLTTLQSISPDLEDEVVIDAAMGDYIFFPLSHVFRQHQTINDRAAELALRCLEILIKTAWRIQISKELAKQLVILITFVVRDTPGSGDGAGEKQRSEETKLAGMKCLLALFGSIKISCKGLLEETQNLPVLGHTVTTILAMLEGNVGMLELQLVMLQTARMLLLECIEDLDTMASFYPGIISGLVKVIGLEKTTKRPYQVLETTIKLIAALMSRVLGDRETANLPEDDKNAEGKGKGKGKEEELKVHRTNSWLKATASQTKLALGNILRLRTHPRIEVRTATFQLCRDLLESCSDSLAEARPNLVESMIVLAGDEDENLATLADSTLRVLAAMSQSVKEAIESALHAWIVALPRIMGSNDEDAKTRTITRLSVAFKIMTELNMDIELLQDLFAGSIQDSLSAANANPKAKGKWTVVPQPVIRGNPVSLEVLLLNRDDSVGRGGKLAQFPDVILGHRSQMETVQSLKRLLGLLANSSENALALAQRHVREASRPMSRARDRATSLWIAVNLLKGSISADQEIDEFIVFDFSPSVGLQRRVMEEIFSVSLNILNNDTETDEEEPAPDEALQCLALESLSLISQVRKKSFRGDLVDALYPVVHLLGAPSTQVQNHAIVALNNIAFSCEYSSARELLLENVDYMVNAVSLKLNTFDLSPQAPVVLGMMVKLAGASLVPYLDDLVESIFGVLEEFHGYEKLCQGLFGVLGAIVEESAKGKEFKAIEGPEGGGDDAKERKRKKRKILTGSDLIAILRESGDKERPRIQPLDDEPETSENAEEEKFPEKPWGKGKGKEKEPKNPFEVEEDEEMGSPPPREEDTVAKPTKSYAMVQKITRLSQHYLTHASPTLRLQLLKLVSTASTILAGNENEFLPLVNDIWPVVFNRLFDEEPNVVVNAAEAISRIALACGDFLASRIREGWGGIMKVFRTAGRKLQVERKQRSSGGYSFSAGYKVWDALCRMFVDVVTNVSVGDEILDEICEALGGEGLRERADLRKALEDEVSDSVWLEIEGSKGGIREWQMPAKVDGVRFAEVAF
ncbi:hypothetical protein RUND412_004612 [Rhizina undulata]